MNKKLHEVMVFLFFSVKHKSNLSKARYTKLVYLADWKMCQRYGHPISNIDWMFNHYGPYVEDVAELAKDSVDFELIVTRNVYGSLKEMINFVGKAPDKFSLSYDETKTLSEVVQETDSMYFITFIIAKS